MAFGEWDRLGRKLHRAWRGRLILMVLYGLRET
jgi:hypothetical protein